MDLRTKFGALLGAGGLLMLAASAVFAAQPTYFISVEKTADPANVPPSGGTVVYTISVTSTGTGFFNVVLVNDGMEGCTLGAPTGDDGDGDLDSGETWDYSCTVTNVMPGDVNTATVAACHNAGGCNQSAHDAAGGDEFTVGEGEEPPATDEPEDPVETDEPEDPVETDEPEGPAETDEPVDPADTEPPFGGEEEGAGAEPTEPSTDSVASSGNGRTNNTVMLVLALGMLLASIVLVTPARPVRQR